MRQISIHKALAGLDQETAGTALTTANISIHKALAGLDIQRTVDVNINAQISIHKALAGLDDFDDIVLGDGLNFNPQGPRGPRHLKI